MLTFKQSGNVKVQIKSLLTSTSNLRFCAPRNLYENYQQKLLYIFLFPCMLHDPIFLFNHIIITGGLQNMKGFWNLNEG